MAENGTSNVGELALNTDRGKAGVDPRRFFAGDVVHLRSGGPDLTVMFAQADGEMIQVGWFNLNNDMQVAQLHPLAVEKR